MAWIVCFQCLPIKLLDTLQSKDQIFIERKKNLNVCDVCRTNQAEFTIGFKFPDQLITNQTLYVGCTCNKTHVTVACPIHGGWTTTQFFI